MAYSDDFDISKPDSVLDKCDDMCGYLNHDPKQVCGILKNNGGSKVFKNACHLAQHNCKHPATGKFTIYGVNNVTSY